jgi:D-glycero-D-manno-heptose 1,7-bisphosphate phosphatase
MGIGGKIDILHSAIFLDRDGIVNKAVVKKGKPYPPSSLVELELIDGIRDLIINVKRLGFKVFIFTNQPDVARGTTSREKVDEIHNFLMGELAIDKIYCCFHDDNDNCDCRKPKPGMIIKAKREWSIDLGKSFVVGDRWRDIAAAKAANIKSILVDYNYNEGKEVPDYSCINIKEVFEIINNNKHT